MKTKYIGAALTLLSIYLLYVVGDSYINNVQEMSTNTTSLSEDKEREVLIHIGFLFLFAFGLVFGLIQWISPGDGK